MKLSFDLDTGRNFIRGYAEGRITVNQDTVVEGSVVVMPDRLVTDWPPETFDALAAEHFEALLELEPEVVLLGTGERQRFPHPTLTRALVERGIGIEVMDTPAACRTYNILMSEERRVAAALIMI
ncbi:MAG: Xcc1710-like domain-containing protein [Gammaproteobacteria bacterium]|nr:Xcc1710-like domain-containing protein [Gammaproteobacteria bacterium]